MTFMPLMISAPKFVEQNFFFILTYKICLTMGNSLFLGPIGYALGNMIQSKREMNVGFAPDVSLFFYISM